MKKAIAIIRYSDKKYINNTEDMDPTWTKNVSEAALFFNEGSAQEYIACNILRGRRITNESLATYGIVDISDKRKSIPMRNMRDFDKL